MRDIRASRAAWFLCVLVLSAGLRRYLDCQAAELLISAFSLNALLKLPLLGLFLSFPSLGLSLLLGLKSSLSEVVSTLFGCPSCFYFFGKTVGLGFARCLVLGREPLHFGFNLSPDVGLDPLLGVKGSFLRLLSFLLSECKLLNQQVGVYSLRFRTRYPVLSIQEFLRQLRIWRNFLRAFLIKISVESLFLRGR